MLPKRLGLSTLFTRLFTMLARDHAATEQYIKEKGLTYTFLRDNFYMDFFVTLAQEYGEISKDLLEMARYLLLCVRMLPK